MVFTGGRVIRVRLKVEDYPLHEVVGCQPRMRAAHQLRAEVGCPLREEVASRPHVEEGYLLLVVAGSRLHVEEGYLPLVVAGSQQQEVGDCPPPAEEACRRQQATSTGVTSPLGLSSSESWKGAECMTSPNSFGPTCPRSLTSH